MNATTSDQHLARLIKAARMVALLGAMENDVFVVHADIGRELRTAIRAFDESTLGEVQELLRERTIGI